MGYHPMSISSVFSSLQITFPEQWTRSPGTGHYEPKPKLLCFLSGRCVIVVPRKKINHSCAYDSNTRINRVDCALTLYGPNSFFRRFSGHNLR